MRTCLLISCVLIGGCATGPLDNPWPPAGIRIDASPVLRVSRAPVAEALGVAALADVEDYVRAAMERSPRVVAADRAVQRLSARVEQVASLDDPMFMVSPAGEMAETAAGEVGLMTSLSQKLPYPGKLSTKGQIASAQAAEAAAQLDATRQEVAAQTRRAYWRRYAALRAIEVTRQSRTLLEDFRRIAEALLESGRAMQQDVLRVAVELGDVDRELIALWQQDRSARAMLNRLLDRAVDADLPAPPTIEAQHAELKLDDLIAQAQTRNPAMEQARRRIATARLRLKLARLKRKPDLNVAVSYSAVDDHGLSPVANGDDQWWLTFAINLPIWSGKYDAAEREAHLGVGEELANLHDAQNRVAFDIEDALSRVESQQSLIVLLRDRIIPDAQQTVDATMSAYQSGEVDSLTLIDNWRKLLTSQTQLHASVAQLHRDLADLEQAIGAPAASKPTKGH